MSSSEFKNLCFSICSNKPKDRKDAIKLLKIDLGKRETIAVLDSNTKQRNAKIHVDGVTWTEVYQSALKYLCHEAEAYKKASVKETSGGAAESRRKSALSDAASNMRFIARSCDHSDAKVFSVMQKMFRQLKKLLSDGPIFDVIRSDLTQLLCEVLAVDDYASALTSEVWQALFSVYSSCVLGDSGIDSNCTAKAIYLLLRSPFVDYMSCSELVFKVFKEYFRKSGRDIGYTQWMLKGLVIMASNVFVECKLLMTKFVSETNSRLLGFLSSPNPTIKHSAVQYYRMVFRFFWKRSRIVLKLENISDIYELIMSSLEAPSFATESSLKGNKGAASYPKMCFIDLACDICHFVCLSHNARAKDVVTDRQKSKRQKFARFVDRIGEKAFSGFSSEVVIVTCFQLFTAMASKYHDTFDLQLFRALVENVPKVLLRFGDMPSVGVWVSKLLCSLCKVDFRVRNKSLGEDVFARERSKFWVDSLPFFLSPY